MIHVLCPPHQPLRHDQGPKMIGLAHGVGRVGDGPGIRGRGKPIENSPAVRICVTQMEIEKRPRHPETAPKVLCKGDRPRATLFKELKPDAGPSLPCELVPHITLCSRRILAADRLLHSELHLAASLDGQIDPFAPERVVLAYKGPSPVLEGPDGMADRAVHALPVLLAMADPAGIEKGAGMRNAPRGTFVALQAGHRPFVRTGSAGMAVRAGKARRPVDIRRHLVPLDPVGPIRKVSADKGRPKVFLEVLFEPAVIVPTHEVSVVAGETPIVRHPFSKTVVTRVFCNDHMAGCTSGPPPCAGVAVPRNCNVAEQAASAKEVPHEGLRGPVRPI